MPTTTRLVAAILLAALGWGVAYLAIPHLPEGKPTGMFSPISAVVGVLVGWFWVAPKIERQTGKPAGLGLAAAVLLGFWVLMIFSGYEMIRRALNLRYDGPVAGAQDMVAIAIDYLQIVIQPEVIGSLLVGGIVIGAVSGWVARRFR